MRSSTRQIGGLNTARPNNAHHQSSSPSSGTGNRYWRAVAALGCTVLALTYMALPGAAQTSVLAGRHGLSVAVPVAARPLTINWALSGQATASTAQPGDPSSNAIDGDAATSWCTASWPDTLTVDLVLGYKKSNKSPILKLLLSRLAKLIARVSKRTKV